MEVCSVITGNPLIFWALPALKSSSALFQSMMCR